MRLVRLLEHAVVLLGMSALGAQAADAPRRIACFAVAPLEQYAKRFCDNVRAGLRERGWKDQEVLFVMNLQKDLVLESGPTEAMRELARGKFDLIVANRNDLARGLKDANPSMPIIVAGHVAGTAEIRGSPAERLAPNVTGVAYYPAPSTTAQAFALVRRLNPKATRVGVVVDANDRLLSPAVRAAWDASAKVAGMSTRWLTAARAQADLDKAISSLRGQVDVILIGSPWLEGSTAMEDVSVRHGIPVVGSYKLSEKSGPIMVLALDHAAVERQVGRISDRILRGASAASVPVEGYSDYRLIIDLTVARKLRIEIPQELLASAAERIE